MTAEQLQEILRHVDRTTGCYASLLVELVEEVRYIRREQETLNRIMATIATGTREPPEPLKDPGT